MKTKFLCVLALLCSCPLVVPSFAQKSPPGASSTPPGVVMTTPPPPAPPNAGEKSARPAASDRYVWVPGHYRPVEGKWSWINGSWHLPPTDISVWIEPKYDAENKLWFTGYWQPDAPSHGPGPSGGTAKPYTP